MFAKYSAVPLGIGAVWLRARRPHHTRGGIAHIDERSKGRLRGFRSPPGDGHIAPAAIAFARRGQHNAVVAV